MNQEITINKLPEWPNRSEVIIGDFHVGIIEKHTICRPCNIHRHLIYIPNQRKPFRLDGKDIEGSLKKIIKKLFPKLAA